MMAKEKKITQTELNKISSSLKAGINKGIKKFSIQDLITWLFDGDSSLEIPLYFRRNKSTLLNNIQMVAPKFRNNLKMISFMNIHLNDLYNKRSPEEILEFLKSYIQQNKIRKEHLDNKFYRFDKEGAARDRFIESMTEFNTQLDGGDFGSIVSEFDMMSTGLFNNKEIQFKIDLALGNKESNQDEFNNNVMEAIREVDSIKRDKDPRFIKVLDQETVDKYQLTLIDIKALEKMNKILLVFIDENNKKKFYIDDFAYEFVISNINSIIWNDYVVPFDPKFHSWVISSDIQDVNRLRNAINKARDNLYRNHAWES